MISLHPCCGSGSFLCARGLFVFRSDVHITQIFWVDIACLLYNFSPILFFFPQIRVTIEENLPIKGELFVVYSFRMNKFTVPLSKLSTLLSSAVPGDRE